jgi:spermidine/putrescine transport system ATP-binding protein
MLEVHDLWKSYEGKPLLRGISFTVAAHETVCLLGASGSGKSTLLRIIAGLETPERGAIRWEGDDLAATPAHLRGFGLVFQDYALFPHLNVTENVAFGLKINKWSWAEMDLRIATVLEAVKMSGFETRKVTDLSGGEQQRVALARALAPQPRMLMFDEPLGALDRNLRETLMQELRDILHASGVPAIYVTHDQEEAFTVADRILMLHDGEIVRSGKPQEVWSHPGSAWAAGFLDAGNVVEGTVRRRGARMVVETGVGKFQQVCQHTHMEGEKIPFLIRREHASLSSEGSIHGQVKDVLFLQNRYKVSLTNGLYFFLNEAPTVGDEIRLTVPQSDVECLR